MVVIITIVNIRARIENFESLLRGCEIGPGLNNLSVKVFQIDFITIKLYTDELKKINYR